MTVSLLPLKGLTGNIAEERKMITPDLSSKLLQLITSFSLVITALKHIGYIKMHPCLHSYFL